MASIKMRLLSEFHKPLSDETIVPLEVLQSIPLETCPLLVHIDAYGDTIFNRSQMEVIISEIESLLNSSRQFSLEERIFLDDLRRLCILGDVGPHRYLWIKGM